MDNISGSANWTVYDAPIKKEKKEINEITKEKIPYIPPKLDFLIKFTNEIERLYSLTPKKELNDVLLSLYSIKKLLS